VGVTITSDWHIHTRNSFDAASMTISELVRGTAYCGIVDYGVTDHFNTRLNFPEIAASLAEYESCPRSPRFHFGIEVSCVSQWEIEQITRGRRGDKPEIGIRSGGPRGAKLALDITEEDIHTYRIEYVIGSSHWPIYAPHDRHAQVREHHRQNIFLATHPLVDIIGHPWYWSGYWKDKSSIEGDNSDEPPWFGEFHKIPASMHDEFAAAVVQNGKVVEINLRSILLRPFALEGYKEQYLDYLSFLRNRGVMLSLGSDCHSSRYEINYSAAAALLEQVGIRDQELWRLPPKPDCNWEGL
jgi:histidinol phosphatase-like PHP family hydrolase